MLEQLPEHSVPIGIGASVVVYLFYKLVIKKNKVIQKNNKVGGDLSGGNIIKTNIKIDKD